MDTLPSCTDLAVTCMPLTKYWNRICSEQKFEKNETHFMPNAPFSSYIPEISEETEFLCCYHLIT
jgi:hypothetical protein